MSRSDTDRYLYNAQVQLNAWQLLDSGELQSLNKANSYLEAARYFLGKGWSAFFEELLTLFGQPKPLYHLSKIPSLIQDAKDLSPEFEMLLDLLDDKSSWLACLVELSNLKINLTPKFPETVPSGLIASDVSEPGKMTFVDIENVLEDFKSHIQEVRYRLNEF